jgi:hypothetical protein
MKYLKDLHMLLSKPFRLPIVAFGGWFMVLYVTVFLAVAAMRIIQPRQYEPRHTSGIIFEWTTTHISRFGAAMLFLAMPGLGVIASSVTQQRIWRQDKALRHNSFHGLTIFRRDLVIALLATATLLGADILPSVVARLAKD